MRYSLPRTALLLIACLPLLANAAADRDSKHPRRTDGEPARATAVALPFWHLQPGTALKVSRITSPAPNSDDIGKLHQRNANYASKRIQIGLPRDLAAGGKSALHVVPHWMRSKQGGFVAHFEVRSVDAAAVRVGLVVKGLDPLIELRFGGSRNPSYPIAATTAGKAQRLLGDDGLYWTPNTDGDAQLIELFVPAGAAVPDVLSLRRLSHQVVDSRTPYRLPQKIGESGNCNVDVVCRLAELGANFANARHAVAHMQFVVGGSGFICTGTLLADNDPGTQVPLFHGANHCFSNNTSIAPNPTQMQTVANTLNTIWNYEATTCDGNVSAATTQLSGGATYLYSSHQTDGMLIRLNDPAPAGAFFAGWNADPLSTGTAVTAIHHPSGDARMVSTGQKMAQDSVNHEVGWLIGTTEGGSSGSGLFTIAVGGAYELRGGLFGGFASCANDGDLGNPNNRDFYSRLDQDFASMSTWLAPVQDLPDLIHADGFEAAPMR